MDTIAYNARELLRRAADLGFGVIAITLHRKVLESSDLATEAARLGILLIPSVELRIDGCDIVVWNISASEAEAVHSFDDLRALRARRGGSIMMMAPHPFYVLGGSIGARIHNEMDCIDAIEYCHFHSRWLNPNRRAVRLAASTGLPLIATSDAHRLSSFGRHFTEIDLEAPPSIPSVFQAIRSHNLRRVSPPMTLPEILVSLAYIFVEHPVRGLLNRKDKRLNQ